MDDTPISDGLLQHRKKPNSAGERSSLLRFGHAPHRSAGSPFAFGGSKDAGFRDDEAKAASVLKWVSHAAA